MKVKKINKKERPSWDEYFLEMVRVVSSRSTCLRRKVGALIVKDRRILATGYNGTPSGLRHCEETGCLREKLKIPSGERQEICRGLHAEQNAIIQAALYGVSIEHSIIYTSCQPCITCAKMIINAGIKEVIMTDAYPDELAITMFKEAKVKIRRLTLPAGAENLYADRSP